MAVISIAENPDNQWVAAGWAFRQILDDTMSKYTADLEIARELEQSKNLGGLVLYVLEPGLAARIASAISEVATGILSGTIRSGIIDQPYGDPRTIEEYREGLQQLLVIMRS